jgi:hypothetical protein
LPRVVEAVPGAGKRDFFLFLFCVFCFSPPPWEIELTCFSRPPHVRTFGYRREKEAGERKISAFFGFLFFWFVFFVYAYFMPREVMLAVF